MTWFLRLLLLALVGMAKADCLDDSELTAGIATPDTVEFRALRRDMESSDPKIRKAAVRKAESKKFTPEEAQALVELAGRTPYTEVALLCTSALYRTGSPEILNDLRLSLLNNPNKDIAIQQLNSSLDQDARAQALTRRLARRSPSLEVRVAAIGRLARSRDVDELRLLLATVSQKQDVEARALLEAGARLDLFHSELQPELTRLYKHGGTSEIKAMAAYGLTKIRQPPPLEDYFKIVTDLSQQFNPDLNIVAQSLTSLHFSVEGLQMAGYYRGKSNAELRGLAMQSFTQVNGYPLISQAALAELAKRKDPEMLRTLTYVEQKYPRAQKLVNAYRLNYLGDISKHILYRDVDYPQFAADRSVPISRFRKTDSELYLLGGPLAGKVVARVIDTPAAEAWNKVYSSDEWAKAGYQTPPIEVPLTGRQVKEEFGLDSGQASALAQIIEEAGAGKSVVFTRVVPGSAIDEYTFQYLGTSEDRTAIRTERERIKGILKRIGVTHGHDHDGNFVVDRSQPSGDRVVMIDFDRSR